MWLTLGINVLILKRPSPMNVWYITSAFNYLVGNTHSRGTCRRRGISWTGSTDTGSCSVGSQDTSHLASSGTRFASGCSVGRNPEDRSSILVISGRFGVVSAHTGGSGDNIWNNETEEAKENWEIYKIRNGQMSLGATEQLPTFILEVPGSKSGRGKKMSWLRLFVVPPCRFRQIETQYP